MKSPDDEKMLDTKYKLHHLKYQTLGYTTRIAPTKRNTKNTTTIYNMVCTMTKIRYNIVAVMLVL